jgi:hypothetical protein
MRTGHKQAQLTCFSEIGTVQKAEQLFLLSCLHRRIREGFSEGLCSTLFAFGYKKTQGGHWAFSLGALAFALGFWLLAFALGHGAFALAFAFCFWLFGVGSFWKGKELLEENC